VKKIYLDACALNRLVDERSSERVVAEAEAVANILGMALAGELSWYSSVLLEVEVQRNPDTAKREEIMELLHLASSRQRVTSLAANRAAELERLGYGGADGLHLAIAEEVPVDVLLTTDDRSRERSTATSGTRK
jgi:predicted nucleic acid-binding protein